MAERMVVGNVEIIALLDCHARAPWNVMFPAQRQEDWEPHRAWLSEDGKQLDLSISSFVVRDGATTILIDTGIGDKSRPFFPKGRLPDALREEGIAVEDVDVVVCSHMHIDHVGWHTTTTADGAFAATFPSSRLVFVRDEWEYFTAPEIAKDQPHIQDCILPIKDTADIELVGGEHQLSDAVTLLPAPGHTPAHTAFVISSGGETAVIWGDLCHHPAQVTELWSPVFDHDPELARRSREQVLERLVADGSRVAAGHFRYPGFGRIVRVDGRRYWRAD